jgi:ribosomal protein S6E (S10)
VEFKAGRIIGDTIVACAARLENREIDVSISHVNRILSTQITGEEMARMLGTIQISAAVSGDTLHVSVPHYRTDIESGIEADGISPRKAAVSTALHIKPTLMSAIRSRPLTPHQAGRRSEGPARSWAR